MSEIEVEKKYNERFEEDLSHYRNILYFLGGNVPIEALCLPKPIETILHKEGLDRVVDLSRIDLTKIKGLGDKRISLLSSRLDEFFSVSI